jgi:hypothetical protein
MFVEIRGRRGLGDDGAHRSEAENFCMKYKKVKFNVLNGLIKYDTYVIHHHSTYYTFNDQPKKINQSILHKMVDHLPRITTYKWPILNELKTINETTN